ncbi:hypothetical protein, partial [Enterobacter cloacae complex sp. P1B]|uniref:hypothetical protein n=1 Tax=Enterobacter cloacae complex sp. P1B TaxID=2779593 RepID=UPI00187518E5
PPPPPPLFYYTRSRHPPIASCLVGAERRETALPECYAGYSFMAVVTPTGSSQPALAGAVQSSPSVDAYGAPSVTNLHIS